MKELFEDLGEEVLEEGTSEPFDLVEEAMFIYDMGKFLDEYERRVYLRTKTSREEEDW